MQFNNTTYYSLSSWERLSLKKGKRWAGLHFKGIWPSPINFSIIRGNSLSSIISNNTYWSRPMVQRRWRSYRQLRSLCLPKEQLAKASQMGNLTIPSTIRHSPRWTSSSVPNRTRKVCPRLPSLYPCSQREIWILIRPSSIQWLLAASSSLKP